MASATPSSSFSPFETNPSNTSNDSFSSYLALVRESFANDHVNAPAASRRSSVQVIVPPRRTSKDNGEIDVFGAERYFSGSLDVHDHPELLMPISVDRKSSKKSSKTCTRSWSSTCSETSAHSRNMLLRASSSQQQPPKQPPTTLRRSLLNVICCSFSQSSPVKVEGDADNNSSTRSPTAVTKGHYELESEPSSDLFEIDSLSMSSQQVDEPSEASIAWSVATARTANLSSSATSERAAEGKVRRSLGLLTFGCSSDKAVSVPSDKVRSLERYHVMMDLQSASVAADALTGRTRRFLLG